jgi:hydrogenase expression/formation protein HypE
MPDPAPIDQPSFSCPIPISEYPRVLLAHGGGGTLSHRLVTTMFLSRFTEEAKSPLHDGATVELGGARIAFTTDSYVVHPIFFPGGNIGELAVNGTVNDLAMCGAAPSALSAGFIIEEGMPMEDLWRLVVSMQEAAERAGVHIVTGDTKVVDRGKGDRIYINTSGIGLIPPGVEIHPRRARAGDAIILSGSIADHGIAIMSVREGLRFSTAITSDTAPLNGLVQELMRVSPDIHVLRDPTRGGVASALNEIAADARLGIEIIEERIPVQEQVRGACEMLGLDPLYVANEGKVLVIAPRTDAPALLSAMRAHPLGGRAEIIGEVTDRHPGMVTMRTRIGGTRVVAMMSGEQLPRIC